MRLPQQHTQYPHLKEKDARRGKEEEEAKEEESPRKIAITMASTLMCGTRSK